MSEQPLADQETNIVSKPLDPRAEAKFDHRVWGGVVVRKAGAYRVLVEDPAGTTEVATIACDPPAGRKVRLRIMVDAVEVGEAPTPKEVEEMV